MPCWVFGSGDKMGNVIFSKRSPGTGPATTMFGFSLLYGAQARPFISFLSALGSRSLGASFQPSGMMAIAPAFIVALEPSAIGCILFLYLAGISMVALKMVSGRTSWGKRTSISFCAK